MTYTFKIRLKLWLCKTFGHKPKYSHTFNHENHYTCTRCGRFVKGDD